MPEFRVLRQTFYARIQGFEADSMPEFRGLRLKIPEFGIIKYFIQMLYGQTTVLKT